MQEVKLVLSQVRRIDAKRAQRAEPGVDAVNRARLGRQVFHQLAAFANQGARPR